MRRHPVLVSVGAALVIWLAACWFLFVRPPVDNPKHADVIVVLGGASGERLPVAMALKKRGVANTVVLSNPGGPDNISTTKQCGKAHNADLICFTPSPSDTRGEARAIATLARSHDWKSIVVVTSAYHVVRAEVLVGQTTHAKIYMVASHRSLSPFVRLRLFVHESGSLADALLRPEA